MISAMINNLKAKVRDKRPLLECDYSRITSVILPYFFPYSRNWCISPEWVATENHKPDYTVFTVNLQSGICSPYLIVEVKNRVAISWWRLMRNQLWDQAVNLKQGNGKLLVIGQIGFEICFFEFDLAKYPSSSGDYTNFTPI